MTMADLKPPSISPADALRAYRAQIQAESRQAWIQAFCASVRQGKTPYQASSDASYASQEFIKQFNN